MSSVAGSERGMRDNLVVCSLFSRDCKNDVRVHKMIYDQIKIMQLFGLEGGSKV